jgi:hypothetical protein
VDGVVRGRRETEKRLAKALTDRGCSGEGLLVLSVWNGGTAVSAQAA